MENHRSLRFVCLGAGSWDNNNKQARGRSIGANPFFLGRSFWNRSGGFVTSSFEMIKGFFVSHFLFAFGLLRLLVKRKGKERKGKSSRAGGYVFQVMLGC